MPTCCRCRWSGQRRAVPAIERLTGHLPRRGVSRHERQVWAGRSGLADWSTVDSTERQHSPASKMTTASPGLRKCGLRSGWPLRLVGRAVGAVASGIIERRKELAWTTPTCGNAGHLGRAPRPPAIPRRWSRSAGCHCGSKDDHAATSLPSTSLRDDGTVRVDNRCLDDNGKPSQAMRRAVPDDGHEGRLRVTSCRRCGGFPSRRANYWVLKSTTTTVTLWSHAPTTNTCGCCRARRPSGRSRQSIWTPHASRASI